MTRRGPDLAKTVVYLTKPRVAAGAAILDGKTYDFAVFV